MLNTKPPDFVMWNNAPPSDPTGWRRYWFGSELNAQASFAVRGIGLREPMINANVTRPIGTGDWLLMFFHEPARLCVSSQAALQPARSMIVWPPGSPQFYSWGKKPNVEPHSWIHCEGSWVRSQVSENDIPVNRPFVVEDESLIVDSLTMLCDEMMQGRVPDPIILHNLFQNWMRRLAHQHGNAMAATAIPAHMLQVRTYLDEHFAGRIVLEELAAMVFLSRSHLCNQFRRHFGATIGNYILRRRMSVAQRLLFDINLRPGEIATMVGYADIYQFSKQFKKAFGVSPTQYRKQQSWDETQTET